MAGWAEHCFVGAHRPSRGHRSHTSEPQIIQVITGLTRTSLSTVTGGLVHINSLRRISSRAILPPFFLFFFSSPASWHSSPRTRSLTRKFEMPPPSPTAYIRDATPADFKQLAKMQTRAFATDPLMLWFGNAQKKWKVPAKDEELKNPLKTLYHFYNGLAKATLLVGGRITMMVDKDEKGKEEILSVAQWIPPGKKLDTPLLILRSKQYKTIMGTPKHLGGWGISGLIVRILSLSTCSSKTHMNSPVSAGCLPIHAYLRKNT